jgi:hypothetical protein
MQDGSTLLAHLVVAIIKVIVPGSTRPVIAESLLLKHQLLIRGRLRRHVPPATDADRLLLSRGITREFKSDSASCWRSAARPYEQEVLRTRNTPRA